MPISNSFKKRLWPIVTKLHQAFKGAFHIFDESGINQTCQRLKCAFKGVPGFMNFYAVKAEPNPSILEIMTKNGFGFDCSSIPELHKAEDQIMLCKKTFPSGESLVNAKIMFTSNNTSTEEFEEALRINRVSTPVIINIDDISMIDAVAELNGGQLPEIICFRYNPGPRRTSGSTAAKFGDPEGQKYGIPHEKIVDAYRKAQELGATDFGLHTMIASNSLNIEYIQETVSMLLEVTEMIQSHLGIKIKFVNMGGGIGIPYKPDQSEFPIEKLGAWTKKIFDKFGEKHGWNPDFNMECGRYITGQHAVLVTKVRGIYHKYQEIVGVDVNTNAIARPKLYGFEGDGYHHIDVISGYGHQVIIKETAVVSVCDSLCENNGRFADQRKLPKIQKGDFVIIQSTGAHKQTGSDEYNSRTKPADLLLKIDGSVKMIRRAQTEEDIDATLYGLDTYVFKRNKV